MIEAESFYRGVCYQDVVEKNRRKGGDILEVIVQREGTKKTVVIVTDYAGLTVSRDTLVYEGEYLQSRILAFGCKESILIFSREEYDGIKREMAMLR
ncbi:hypothetical protein [Aneurinibacillus aneurinilyticus]|uniref:hypothetical protein n=1 Tax=Aneurinibacillus aneurinilyticus TaxID=1391 RepID=UPI003526531F